MQRTDTMLTVGHGWLSADALGSLLGEHEVQEVVDVRRFPGSRRHPHVNRSSLASWLPDLAVDYRWDERLGGRRHGSASSSNTSVRNASFRAYADHMGQAPWQQALSRLIADAAVLLHGMPVEHLMHDGRRHAHPPMPEARVVDGQLQYDR